MNVFKKIYTVAEAAVSATVDVIVEAYEAFIVKCSTWIDRYRHFIEKADYVEAMELSNAQYTPNTIDIVLAHKCQAYIDAHMPNGLVDVLKDMSFEERKEYVSAITKDFAEIMDVDISDVMFFSPRYREELFYLGQFERDSNTIVLNDAFLSTLEAPELTEHVVLTILHELKHARQYSAVMGNNDYGYDQALLDDWRYDFAFYIHPEESDEAYRNQPLERDTFGWTETQIKIHAKTL